MTDTNQVSEDDVRRQINKIFDETRIDYEGVYEPRAEELLIDLITADRKRVALEARISELKMWELPENEIQMVFANPCNICGHDYPKLRKAQQDRLSALKAQQEEV